MENDEKRVSFINTYEEKDRDILEERVQKQIEEIENNEMKKEEDINNIKENIIKNRIRLDDNFEQLSKNRGDKNAFLILVEYRDDCDADRYWEIIENRQKTYTWLKENMKYIDLIQTRVVSETLSFTDDISAAAFMVYCLDSGKIEDPGFDPRGVYEELPEGVTIDDLLNDNDLEEEE